MDNAIFLSQITYDDDTPLPFGKYKGLAVSDVPAGYLFWMDGEKEIMEKNPGLKKYIDDNREALEARKKEETAEYFREKNRAAKDLTGKTISFDEE